MWRNGLLSGLAFLVTMTSAFADELKSIRKASPTGAAAKPLGRSWTGFYAGPTLGWAVGKSEGFYQGGSPLPLGTPPELQPKPAEDCSDDSVATGASLLYVICAFLDPVTPGALFGYNVQWMKLIVGLEGDIGWIGRHSPQIPASDGSQRWDQFGVTWNGHLRGRLGYPLGNYLPYVAGGLAIARFNAAHYRSDTAGSALYETHDTRFGYTLGTGVEIADLFPKLLPGLVLRGEYLYDYFPEKQYDWVPGMRYSVLDLTIHTLRGALIYRFSAGPSLK